MAYILSKVGQSFNVPIHIYEADTEEDMNSIDIQSIPMGSKCHIINNDKWYMLNSDGKWKAMPKQVQPDWNQNDDTAADYVKNRPFYTGDPVETVLVEESTVQFTDIGGGLYTGAIESTFSPIVGDIYKISWDGTDYESTCVNVGSYTYIGNLSIDGSGPDTGEPFLMQVINQEIGVATLDYASYRTISISRFVPGVVVKIDPKYLPDNPLNITGATVGQIAKITAVDDTGKPTAWEPVDMPNNKKFIITFSGNDSSYACDKTMDEIVNAYENGQDISAYFTGTTESGNTYTNLLLSLTTYDPGMYIEFSSGIQTYKLFRIVAFIDGTGYCGVSESTALDSSLTNDSMAADAKAVGDALVRKQDTLIQGGATVGQIAKITAVDESGKPTAWEAVDMPSGGGGGGVTTLHINVTAINLETKEPTFTADKTPTEMLQASANGPIWCVISFAAGLMGKEAVSFGVPPTWGAGAPTFGTSVEIRHREDGGNDIFDVVKSELPNTWILNLTAFG